MMKSDDSCGRLLVHRRQGPDAPPGVVIRPASGWKRVPVVIGGVLALGRPQLRVEAVGVEVAAVVAGVVEHPVQHHPDAPAVRPPGTGVRKSSSVPSMGSMRAVVRGVVAVVAVGLKNGTQVQRVYAQTLQVVQLGGDPRQTAAEEVAVADLPCSSGRHTGVSSQSWWTSRSPTIPAGSGTAGAAEPVREDLIGDAPAEPGGGRAAVVINRQLPPRPGRRSRAGRIAPARGRPADENRKAYHTSSGSSGAVYTPLPPAVIRPGDRATSCSVPGKFPPQEQQSRR